MDAREEAAELLLKAARAPISDPRVSGFLVAIVRLLDAIDTDIQKIRKELRTRSEIGGEDG